MVDKCTKCDLFISRTNIVNGIGNPKAKVVLVGEAPGYNEDKAGEPFVGRPGKHLKHYLRVAGIDKEDVFMTNVVRCRPYNNATPTWNQMNKCLPHLQEELKEIKPVIVILLGSTAVKAIRGSQTVGVNKYRHKWFTYTGKTFYTVTFHPSASLRSKDVRPNMIADFLMIGEAYKKHVDPFAKPCIETIKMLLT